MQLVHCLRVRAKLMATRWASQKRTISIRVIDFCSGFIIKYADLPLDTIHFNIQYRPTNQYNIVNDMRDSGAKNQPAVNCRLSYGMTVQWPLFWSRTPTINRANSTGHKQHPSATNCANGQIGPSVTPGLTTRWDWHQDLIIEDIAYFLWSFFINLFVIISVQISASIDQLCAKAGQ